MEAGTGRGADVLSEVAGRPAGHADTQAADLVTERTAASMGRQLDTGGIKDMLYDNFEHPRWDDVASRCLTCGNCTMVCPTCFCFSITDVNDLTGSQAEQQRSWDSCFTMDHSYVHGGSVRASSPSRYRQWMTHKLPPGSTSSARRAASAAAAASPGARSASTSPKRRPPSGPPTARREETTVDTLEDELRNHPFLADLAPAYLTLLAGCAANVHFPAGAFLFREGTPADQCFLLRKGKVALEIAAGAGGPSSSRPCPPGR